MKGAFSAIVIGEVQVFYREFHSRVSVAQSKPQFPRSLGNYRASIGFGVYGYKVLKSHRDIAAYEGPRRGPLFNNVQGTIPILPRSYKAGPAAGGMGNIISVFGKSAHILRDRFAIVACQCVDDIRVLLHQFEKSGSSWLTKLLPFMI